MLETKEEALCLEQMLLDYIFKINIKTYNISLKARGGKNLQDYSAHGGLNPLHKGYTAIKRFALNLNTNQIYVFKSGVEASKFTGVSIGHVLYSCNRGLKRTGNGSFWLFATKLPLLAIKPRLRIKSLNRDFVYYHLWAQSVSNLSIANYCKSQVFTCKVFSNWKTLCKQNKL